MARLALACVALTLSGCALTPPPTRGIFLPEVPADAMPRAGVLDPTIDRSPWTFAGRTGQVLTTPNFRIHTTLGDSMLRRRLPGFVEMALAQYQRGLGPLNAPDSQMQTFVVATRSQWEELTHRVAGLNAPTYLRIQRGGFAAGGKGVYWDIGTQDTLMIAAHEGWHQFTQVTFSEPLPLWLEEGIATYMEGFRWHPTQRDLPVFLPWANTERFDILRQRYSSSTLMSLPMLLNSRPQDLIQRSDADTLTYYAQVWALVHFLKEHHPDDLAAMLADAQRGTYGNTVAAATDQRAASLALTQRVGDAPFRAYFGDDLKAMSDDYDAFMARIVQPGSRGEIVAGRPPPR